MDVRKLMDDKLTAWRRVAGDVETLVRYVPRSEYEAIEKDCMEMNYLGGQRNEVRNEKKFRSLLARATVRNWRGIVDGGNPYPCTPENIDYLVEECAEFRFIVLQAPFSLAWFLEEQETDGENIPAAAGPDEALTE